MGRVRNILLTAAAMAVLAATPADAATRPLAKVRLLDCVVGVEEPGRATFEGDVQRVAGTLRMQMKFVLQAQSGGKWGRVVAPGTGVWSTSNPNVSRYVYTKTFENLVAPRRYRVQVHFRWLSLAGTVLRKATRVSRSCRQPDQRPQLSVTSVVAEHTRNPGNLRYFVEVRNTGRLDAGPFGLELQIGNEKHGLARTDLIPGSDTVVLAGEGPACEPDSLIVLRVDPLAEVDERDETDNALTVPCPVPQRG